MIKFEQVSSDHHQMRLPEGGGRVVPSSDVGEGVLYDVTFDMMN